jgi:hypothetical protein
MLRMYLDTGLTPEECANAKTIIYAAFSDDTSKAERIRELLKADKEEKAMAEYIGAPTADVAPVVRCKDCKHHYDCGVHFCDRLGMDCPDDSDFFCSYGERKGGDSNALD